VAVTAAFFGVYLAIAGPDGSLAPSAPGSRSLANQLRELWRRAVSPDATAGWACTAISLIWLVAVVFVAMPWLNSGAKFPVPEGYEHLGTSPVEILRGIVGHPGTVLRDMVSASKIAYVFWLLAPLAFLSMAAPEALVVAGPALSEILISRYPPHFYVFERYTAPILPVVFLAVVMGAFRLSSRVAVLSGRSHWLMALLLLCTLGSQAVLRKFPTEFRFDPDPHAAAELAVAALVPADASVAVADHRLLAHLANRRGLYVLSPEAPSADYILFNRGRAPITQIAPSALRLAEERFVRDPAYRGTVCEQGVILLAREDALRRDEPVALPREPARPPLAEFGRTIAVLSVRGTSAEERYGLEITWRATGRGYPDYQVFVHLVDASGRILAQSDAGPQLGQCPTSAWAPGVVVRDQHPLQTPAGTGTAVALRIGLYSLDTLARVRRTDGGDTAPNDFVELSWPIGER
jgi:hypothetical protein